MPSYKNLTTRKFTNEPFISNYKDQCVIRHHYLDANAIYLCKTNKTKRLILFLMLELHS